MPLASNSIKKERIEGGDQKSVVPGFKVNTSAAIEAAATVNNRNVHFIPALSTRRCTVKNGLGLGKYRVQAIISP